MYSTCISFNFIYCYLQSSIINSAFNFILFLLILNSIYFLSLFILSSWTINGNWTLSFYFIDVLFHLLIRICKIIFLFMFRNELHYLPYFSIEFRKNCSLLLSNLCNVICICLFLCNLIMNITICIEKDLHKFFDISIGKISQNLKALIRKSCSDTGNFFTGKVAQILATFIKEKLLRF